MSIENTDQILIERQAHSRVTVSVAITAWAQSLGLLFYNGADDDIRLLSIKVRRLWVTPPPLGIIPKSVVRWQKSRQTPASNQIQSFQRHETSGPCWRRTKLTVLCRYAKSWGGHYFISLAPAK
jgi:hypothetical protein